MRSLDNAIKNSKQNPFLLICFMLLLGFSIYLLYMLFFDNTKTVIENGVEKKESQLVKILVTLLFIIPFTFITYGFLIS